MKRLPAAISLFALALISIPTAVAQTNLVNHLTMNQWVQSTSDGALQGRVILPMAEGRVDAKDVTIAILGRDGEVLRTKSNDKGEFTIPNVAPGVYALTARGDYVFACCAMQVIDSDNALAGEFPAVAELSLANVDYTVVNTAVIRYMPPKAKTNILFNDVNLETLSSRVCGQDLFRVAQNEGGMKGQIHLAGATGANLTGAELTNVFIFKDGAEIERTLTDDQGRFLVEKLPPGQYSLLAVGAGGLGLIGFELVGLTDQAEVTNDSALHRSESTEQLVGLFGHGGCCHEFALQIAPMPEIVSCFEESVIVDTGCVCEPGCMGCPCCEEVIIDEQIVYDDFFAPVPGCGCVTGESAGYGGYGGGGFGGGGGGGGGFGGGGLGGIAALAGIGAVIAASDDDTNFGQPVIASPAVPIN